MADYVLAQTAAEVSRAIAAALTAAQKIRFTDVAVAASFFIEDTTYESFPYRATVALAGVTAAMVPEVVFGVGEATSGIFAPVAETYDGGIYLYAAEIPEADFEIPTIIIWKE